MNTSSLKEIRVKYKLFQNLLIAVTLCLVFAAACSNPQPDHEWYTHSPESSTNILFSTVEIDTLFLEDVSSSLEGKIFIKNEELHFFDYRFGWLYTFDENGALLDRKLGLGNGPSELPAGNIAFHTQTDANGHVFIGTSFDFYTFDADHERTYTGRINWKQDKPIEYLNSNPVPEDQRSYDLAYGIGNIHEANGLVYLPLMGGIPGQTVFNFTTDVFAKEARLLAIMDKNTGNVLDMVGRYPPIYRNFPGARAFPFFFFDVKPNGNFVFSFAADPYVHIFTNNFEHVASFGVVGRDMNMNYEPIPEQLTGGDFADWIMDQSEDFDYYTSIKYVPETNLILRGYVMNGNPDYDGMQVYEDGVLIADFKVPSGFRIAGYSNSTYYSEVVPDFSLLEKRVYTLKLSE